MNNVAAALPRKSLTPVEREFLKQGNRMLLNQFNGRVAAAALMDTAGSRPAKAGFAKQSGINKPATVVDHIQPHRGDLTLFWDRTNWQLLCTNCQAAPGEVRP